MTTTNNTCNKQQRIKYSKQKYEYVDELNDDNVYELEFYNGFELNRYYYDFVTETLYLFTRNRYKIIKPSYNGHGNTVCLIDVKGKYHNLGYDKLMRELKQFHESESDIDNKTN